MAKGPYHCFEQLRTGPVIDPQVRCTASTLSTQSHLDWGSSLHHQQQETHDFTLTHAAPCPATIAPLIPGGGKRGGAGRQAGSISSSLISLSIAG
jgi:hypothetical protein